jgi:hypothetical protein
MGLEEENHAIDFEDQAEEHERKAKSMAMWNIHVSIPNSGRAHGSEGHHGRLRRYFLDVASHLRGQVVEFNTAPTRFDPRETILIKRNIK